MKLEKNIALCLTLSMLGPSLTGCQTQTTVAPLRNGYEEVSHPQHTLMLMTEPDPPRISFQHRAGDGTVTQIWPSLYGVSEVIHDNLAIFVGERAGLDPERVTHPRLFAVRPAETPLDITDEILQRWSQASGKNFSRAQTRLTLITPSENNGRLQLQLEFNTGDKWVGEDRNWPDQSALELNWNQVREIFQTVKTKGTPQKDLRWGTPFIGEKS